MWQQLLKHREALLGGVIVLMVLAIGSRVPSFIGPATWWRCLTTPPFLSSSRLGR
jgi:hypothetical protein